MVKNERAWMWLSGKVFARAWPLVQSSGLERENVLMGRAFERSLLISNSIAQSAVGAVSILWTVGMCTVNFAECVVPIWYMLYILQDIFPTVPFNIFVGNTLLVVIS